MIKIAKPLAIGATILYILGVFFTAWYLIALPDYLMESSAIINIDAIAEINPLHNELLLLAGATLASGILVITLLTQLLLSKDQHNTLKYEETEKDNRQTNAKLDETGEGESFNVSAMSDALLAAIRQAAASKEHADKKLEKALRVICNQLQASQGAVYVGIAQEESRSLELRAGYALMKPDSQVVRYEYGEGLPGQVAKEGQLVNLNTVPDGYIKVLSGLGSASPNHLLLVPIRVNDQVAGVVEIASFNPLNKQHEELVKQSFEIMAKIIEESSQQAASQPPLQTEDEELINHPIKR